MHLTLTCLWLATLCSALAAEAAEPVGKPFEVEITSSLDGTEQPSLVQIPQSYTRDKKAPLLVGLHTWSGEYHQQAKAMGPRANKLGWLLIMPNFRGPNLIKNPNAHQACGSLSAQRDIVDAVNYMKKTYAVDESRIYLIGQSGGGHMSMMMAGKYPDLWAGVSAWVGISDLRLWQEENKGYGRHVQHCMGGKPGHSAEVDWQYLTRSPITFIQNASPVNLDLQAGRHDKCVPFHHTVDAFNRVAQVPGHRARLTVFEGGHQIHYAQAFDWVAKQVKAPAPPKTLWLTTDEAKTYFYAYLAPAVAMKLGRCKINLADDGKMTISTEGIEELRIDLAAAGLAKRQALDVDFAGDGQCETLVLTNAAEPAKVEKGGAASAAYTYDAANKALRVGVKGLHKAKLRVAW